MKRLIWIDGRLSWPLVIAVVFPSLSLIVVDFVWRVVVLPIEWLLLYAFLVDGAAAALLIGSCAVVRRRKSALRAAKSTQIAA